MWVLSWCLLDMEFVSDELGKIWPLLVAYFFPPLGKETVIPLGIGVLKEGLTVPLVNIKVSPVSINPLSMALAVAFIDIIVALFLIWNYDLAKKYLTLARVFDPDILDKGKSQQRDFSYSPPEGSEIL